MSQFSMEEQLLELVKNAGREINTLKRQYIKCEEQRKELTSAVKALEKEAGVNAQQIANALRMIDVIQTKINN